MTNTNPLRRSANVSRITSKLSCSPATKSLRMSLTITAAGIGVVADDARYRARRDRRRGAPRSSRSPDAFVRLCLDEVRGCRRVRQTSSSSAPSSVIGARDFHRRDRAAAVRRLDRDGEPPHRSASSPTSAAQETGHGDARQLIRLQCSAGANKKPRPTAGAGTRGEIDMNHGSGTGNRTPIRG